MQISSESTSGIAFIGFGEAAEAFSTGWGRGIASTARAFDIKLEDAAAAALPRERAERSGVALMPDRETALSGAKTVFCLATADCAVAAAEQAAPFLAEGAFWLDGNSCSPGSKRQAARLIEAAGGRYVDVAIMSPVYPSMHHAPLLIAGPDAADAAETLAALDMKARIAGKTVGEASSIKMIRSVMIKGMEALTAECLLAARRAGVEERVLASLQASNPDTDWSGKAAYNLERMMLHGRRRAAEMREVAVTLDELGLPNGLARATAEWQQRVADMSLDAGEDDYLARADAILRLI